MDYNLNIDTQKAYDRHNFTLWCYNLFELNERLYIEQSISNKLYINENGYLLRSYFVVLWEIIYNGKKFLERQEDKAEKHLSAISKLINELMGTISDDDYFMIKYYRNCASHIFLTSYSVLDEKDIPKDEDSETPFYTKAGKKYYLNYDKILEKVEKVFGSKLGVSEEPRYKNGLISRLYPIIHKYHLEISEIDKKNDKTFNDYILSQIVLKGC